MSHSVQFHRYAINNSQGALIRIDGGVSSIYPWPMFGDEPLDRQLYLLRNNQYTSLTNQAMHFAKIDAEARQKGISLFEQLPLKESHQLLTPERKNAQIPLNATVKIKVRSDTELPKDISRFSRLRLDCNGTFTFDGFLQFWTTLPEIVRERVEFVEDPCPYTDNSWYTLFTRYRVPLAYDFYANTDLHDHYKVRIIKPLAHAFNELVLREMQSGKKIVVTSCMDHPVGLVTAAWVSSILSVKYPGAVLTGGYSPTTTAADDPFTAEIFDKQGVFIPPSGTGFGFDGLLRSLHWETL